MSKVLLSVRNLSMTYPDGTEALKNVSFNVHEGEFLVVIGLSGSGKSTLLRCINRLIDPTQGEIRFNNVRIDNANGQRLLRARQEIAMIFQQFNLVPRLSALNNVITGSLGQTPTWKSIFHLYSQSEKDEALRLMQLVGIDEKSNSRADQLSGGQQQRVAIARALYQKPKLLLADEPVASLDPATCHTVMSYLQRANRELGITVICNLHFLSLVRDYATRVIALRAGELVFEGSPQSIDQSWFRRIYGQEAKDIHVD